MGPQHNKKCGGWRSNSYPGLDGREILSSPPHSTKGMILILRGLVKDQANGPTPQGREMEWKRMSTERKVSFQFDFHACRKDRRSGMPKLNNICLFVIQSKVLELHFFLQQVRALTRPLIKDRLHRINHEVLPLVPSEDWGITFIRISFFCFILLCRVWGNEFRTESMNIQFTTSENQKHNKISKRKARMI